MGLIKREAKHIVSFLGKWTELDIMYYMRGGAWSFLQQALVQGCALLLAAGFGYWTSKEMFGQFQFILAVLNILGALALMGANNAALLGAAQNKDGTLLQSLRLKFKWSWIGMLGLLISAGYYYLKQNDLWVAFIMAVFFFPLIFSFGGALSFFSGRRKFSWQCLFTVLSMGASSLAALVTLYFTRDIVFVFLAWLIVRAAGMIVAQIFAQTRMRNSITDPDFVSHSKHMTIINFIPHVRNHFDKVIVTFFLGFAATAVYSIAASIGEQLFNLSRNLSNVIFPKLAERDKEKAYKAVRRRTGKLMLLFGIVALVGVLISPFIIPLFFSDKYVSAVPIAQLLLFASVPRGTAFVISRVHEAQKEQKKLYKITLTYAVVEMIAMLALAPFFGLYGIVGAKFLSNAVYFAVAWRSLH